MRLPIAHLGAAHARSARNNTRPLKMHTKSQFLPMYNFMLALGNFCEVTVPFSYFMSSFHSVGAERRGLQECEFD